MGKVLYFKASEWLLWVVISHDSEHNQSFIVPLDMVNYLGSFDVGIHFGSFTDHAIRLTLGLWVNDEFLKEGTLCSETVDKHYVEKSQYVMSRIVNDTWVALPSQDLTQIDPAYEEHIAIIRRFLGNLTQQYETFLSGK